MNDKVQCLSCGFLGKFSWKEGSAAPRFFEIDKQERIGGMAFHHTPSPHHGTVHTIPICFRSVKEVNDELGVFSDFALKIATHEKMRSVIPIFQRERDCQEWCEYTPGFDPKEHLAEVRIMRLELERQRFQKTMADDQNAIMLRLDAEQKVINGKNRLFQWVLFAVAALEVFVGLLQVLYPSGWPLLQSFVGITPGGQAITQPLQPWPKF